MSKQAKRSAGLLMYRRVNGAVQIFLVHPGGPYWSKKNEGAWTIPKGEYESDEEPLRAAVREFQEETGFGVSEPFLELGAIRQKSGKIVTAWAFEGDCDATKLVSNTCEIEWPPRSKQRIVIPEIDQGSWFALSEAADMMRQEQQPFLDRLQKLLGEQ